MKIYLDFDDTILNTNAFIEELIKIFERAGFSEKDFYDNYEKTKEKVGDFDLDTIFNFFRDQKDFDVIKTRKSVDKLFANVDIFVYEDFFNFVDGFKKNELGILSFGTTFSQREKIENSKIVPFFGEVIITSKSKENNFIDIVEKNQNEKIFFVDDKADQVDKVKAKTPEVIVIKIERPEGRYRKTKSDLADYVVKDFYEVKDIIKNKEN